MNPLHSSRNESSTSLERSLVPSILVQRLRKLAILTLFFVVLGPVIVLNSGVSLEQAGFPILTARLQKAVPSLDALLLRQHWSLFTYISPFNYTAHFEVVLNDGSTLPLHDPAPQRATGWKGFLFHSELKIQNNLYGSPAEHRRYLEYLIRRNGIDPAEVSQRIIYIRYRNLLPRAEAAKAGTHYGPEIRYDLHRW